MCRPVLDSACKLTQALSNAAKLSLELDRNRVEMRITHQVLAIGWIVCWCGVVSASDSDEPIDFNRDIRPLLSDNCFVCHGPDEESREADLRLDQDQHLLDGYTIIPGNANGSELVARIESKDPDQVMPPAESEKSLTSSERALIRRWVEQGAEVSGHWAFEPPQHQELPDVSKANWVRNPIDRFVLSKLEAQGWQPSPPADPVTLARRVYLDLIGLPPSPDQVQAFLDDPNIESLAQDLLDSPHFG